ncbi:MAG TPA: flagellar basal body-associated FliL family protein, partial [Burkholderiaceae bacterium]|nr:flagellar basal body-associated FliL family protein [Burkholderiaceae bacterium]
PEADAAEASPALSKKKKLIIVIVAAVLLLSVGITAAWLMMSEPAPEETADAPAPPEPRKIPVFVDLSSFTVNLHNPNEELEDRYLQIKLVAEVKDQPASEVVKNLMPAVRNEIILLLSTKRADEILSREGKEALVKDIVAAANRPLARTEAEQGVESINITHMIVQ